MVKKASILTAFIGFLVFSCTSSPDDLTDEVSWVAEDLVETLIYEQDLEPGDLGNLAVIPFADSISGESDRFSQYFAEEMITALLMLGESELKIFERSQINSIMKEAEFNASGMVLEDSAMELGRMVGADTLIIGSFKTAGQQLRINCRLVKVESGQILSAAAGEIPLEFYLELKEN